MTDQSVRVQELRKALRMNQQAFAAALGVAQGTISRWENKQQEPTLSMLQNISSLAEKYGIPFDPLGGSYNFITERSRKIDVVGSAQRYTWKKDWRWSDNRVPPLILPERPEWSGLEIEGFLIEDRSAELLFMENSIALVARYKKGVIEPEIGDGILFVDQNDKGQSEVTFRSLVLQRGRRLFLRVESNHPHFSEDVELPFGHPAEISSDEAYGILGLYGVAVGVVSVYRARPRGQSV